MQKLEIYSIKNTSTQMKTQIQIIFQETRVGSGKHLGMPTIIGRKKNIIFNYIWIVYF